MIFYYKIDFVSVADIAFKINHVGSYGVAIAPISARSLWSHAETLARLMPRSLSHTRSRPRSLWSHGLLSSVALLQ